MSNQVVEQWKKAQEGYQVAKNIAEQLAASLKPAGYYNIPPLLDRRRLEYGVPNGAFESYPCFDKCYIWQVSLPGQGNEHYHNSRILKPEAVQSYERNTTPRGILISAGLQALDCLRSTGVEVGHLVRFKKMSPFCMEVAQFDGKSLTVMVVRDGDIDASEDLSAAMNARTAAIVNVSDSGYDHRIQVDGTASGQKRAAYYDASV